MKPENEKNPKKAMILAVDDVPRNLQILGAIMKKKPWELALATDGIQALQIVQENKPDLILLDVMMPDMDGFEVCKILKSDEETAHIPIIFLTALVDTEDVIRGFKAGAADYVAKPFKAAELLARVETHLALKEARDAQTKLIEDLQKALAHVKELSGMLPICAHCKKIRNDKGYWEQVEVYVTNHSEAQFTHGFCPDCIKTYYSEYIETGDIYG